MSECVINNPAPGVISTKSPPKRETCIERDTDRDIMENIVTLAKGVLAQIKIWQMPYQLIWQ